MLTTHRSAALGALRPLHGATTLPNRERMAVDAAIPMTRAAELGRHGGDDHRHLRGADGVFAEHRAHAVDFFGHA